jgi:hypothetical protein
MKGIVINLFFFLLLSGFSLNDSYAQSESLFADIRSALKAGSSKELSQHFHDNIQLNINGDEETYSNVHAEIYLKEFFKKHEPISFEYAHRGGSPQGLNYAIGNYVHSEGTFVVLIRTKKFDGKQKIYIIDFNKE